MDAAWEKAYLAMEEEHFWAVARREFLFDLLSRYGALGKSLSIADFGCSSGVLLEELSKRGESNLVGIDISEQAVCLAQKRGMDARVADAQEPDFPDYTFDVLLASDLLEHLPDRDLALRRWYQLLRPGGTLIVCVPCGAYLWGQHDQINQHYLRYSLKQLQSQLIQSQFVLAEGGYWNSFLLPVALVMSTAEKLGLGKTVEETHKLHWARGIVNSVMLKVMKADNALKRFGVCLPFGISCYAVAVKQDCGKDSV